MMGRNADKYTLYEMSGGVYNTRKLPKWRFNQVDMLEYIQSIEEDTLLPDHGSE